MPKSSPPKPVNRRGQPAMLVLTTLVALIVAATPVVVPAAAAWQHASKINSLAYKQKYGKWETLPIPEEFRQNTIHAAALPTGKILLVAGSGNKRDNFTSYVNEGNIQVLATAIFNPEDNSFKKVATPSDLFCAGHALLHSGSLLIAGGTSGYELLEDDVKKPAGAMVLHNEDPDSEPRLFKRGTVLVGPRGHEYVTTQDVWLQPAHKMDYGQGNVEIHHSSTKVFVEAVGEEDKYLSDENEQYQIKGLKGTDRQNMYGQGGPMTRNKQDYRGDNKSYEFDPIKEEYVQVGDLNESRWYASLPVLTNGNVLAISGLDNVGQITTTTEQYDAIAKKWNWGPDQEFPTYPAVFRTENPDVLFFSGSSSGYGPQDIGRQPGFWNYKTDTFTPVGGLRDSDALETSSSVMLPPDKGSNDGSQHWQIMVLGGGGIGESDRVTDRTDIVDLKDPIPHFTPGPTMPTALRYPNVTVTPWDELFVTGGSKDYRAKGNSYSYRSFSINPTTNSVIPMADATVGRSYHSGSLLLRDGRILVFGNDPLYADAKNTIPGTFEQRIEIFTPPHFFSSERPAVAGPDSQQAGRGQQLSFTSKDASNISYARLIPPSSTTHVTNLEQRSIGVPVSVNGSSLSVQLPTDENLLPNGWYMLFMMNGDGMPSTAKMIHIVR